MVGKHVQGGVVCANFNVFLWSLEPAILVSYIPFVWENSSANIMLLSVLSVQMLTHSFLVLSLIFAPLIFKGQAIATISGISILCMCALTAYAMPNIGTLVRMFAAFDVTAAAVLVSIFSSHPEPRNLALIRHIPYLEHMKLGRR
jgi:hypothetical protein